jgi:hypothetical protein
MYPVDFKFKIIKMTERHAAQAPALRERFPQIFNIQSSLFNYTISVSAQMGSDLEKTRVLEVSK